MSCRVRYQYWDTYYWNLEKLLCDEVRVLDPQGGRLSVKIVIANIVKEKQSTEGKGCEWDDVRL